MFLPCICSVKYFKHWRNGTIFQGKEKKKGWLSSQEHMLFFQRTWVWVPTHTWWLTTICNCSSRESIAHMWFVLALGMHMGHRHTCSQSSHTHEISKCCFSWYSWTFVSFIPFLNVSKLSIFLKSITLSLSCISIPSIA